MSLLNFNEFKKNISRFFFFNQLNTTNFLVNNVFLYFIFYIFNSSNLILKKNNFFLVKESVRVNYKKKQISNNYIYDSNNNFDNTFLLKSFMVGLFYLWVGVRLWLIPLLFFLMSFFFMFFAKLVPVYKISFVFFTLSSFFYWLLSGFVFFIKKYQYRYFTSALQRFWKRTMGLFWMLEFFLFFCFFYLTVMSSQEPFFMFDNSQINKTHLFSWKLFLMKIFPILIVIVLTYISLVSLKWLNFSKINFIFTSITFILFYILWVEFYQFFHLMSYYNNFIWNFEEDENYWFLENDIKRTRISNHFLTICLVAKFWHVVFAAYFWMFFVIRCLELNRPRYPLLSANLQNFVFVYILSWLYMYPWVKYFFLKLYNTPYYWFYVNNKKLMLFIFTNDIKLFLEAISFDVKYMFRSIFFFDKGLVSELYNYNFNKDFFYNRLSSDCTTFTQFKKNYIKDIVFKNI